MIRRKFKVKVGIFNGLKIIILSALGLLVRHGDKLFKNQTLNLELYVGPIF